MQKSIRRPQSSIPSHGSIKHGEKPYRRVKQHSIPHRNVLTVRPGSKKRMLDYMSISPVSEPESVPDQQHTPINISKVTQLFNKRQLHPKHVYGEETPRSVSYEPAVEPVRPVIPSEFHDKYIQYISGYEFLPIKNLDSVQESLHKALSSYNVVGRIYVNHDGINLQMSSHPSKTQDVISTLRTLHNGIFSNTRIFANDIVDGTTIQPLFTRLDIIKRPILNDGLDTTYSQYLTQYIDHYNHLSPQEWHDELEKAKNITNIEDKPIILDIRNLYEYELGAFEGSIAVDVDAYRDTFTIVDTLLGIDRNIPQNLRDNNQNEHQHEHEDSNNNHNNASSHQHKHKHDDDNCSKKHTHTHKHSPDATTSPILPRKVASTPDDPLLSASSDIHPNAHHIASHVPRSQVDVRKQPKHGAINKDMDTELRLQTLSVGKLLQRVYKHHNDNPHDQQGRLELIDAPQIDDGSTTNLKNKHSPLKNRKILAYCTGGIRCIKLGAYLIDQGFTDVNVLNGGVNAYAVYTQNYLKPEETLFKGSNVVFDQRRAVQVGTETISSCHQCDTPTAIQRNCSNTSCDILYIQCKSCEESYSGTCSVQCAEDAFGLGDVARESVKTRQKLGDGNLRLIASPPIKDRIRPRLSSYSIVQHAPHLSGIINSYDKTEQQYPSEVL